MKPDKVPDRKGGGTKSDPNAGRPTPGGQDRPMTQDEARDTSSNDSMDASDPPAIPSPNGGDPVPSSLSPDEAKKPSEADSKPSRSDKAGGKDHISPPTKGSTQG